jgi:light-regulated signal transduction histidine kinase (bacteriophytochrome)/ActR/RegA family two-component response regulator
MGKLKKAEDPGYANYERERAHLLGAVQPRGFLIAVNADCLVIRSSENIGQFLGLAQGQIFGLPLDRIICVSTLHAIKNRLQISSGPGTVERLFNVPLSPDLPPFDIAVHFSGREAVMEFEPAPAGGADASALLRMMVSRMQTRTTLAALQREAVRQIRAITGFDRVMVYRFDDEGSGEVVAESMKSGLTSYLGLHHPAADIIAQERELYNRNLLRVVFDTEAVPVPITPALSPDGQAFDLSLCVLRSASPMQLQCLQQMNVRCALSIALMQGGNLRGLIACEHSTAKYLSLEMRSTIELFGQIFSYMAEARQHEDDAAFEARADAVNDRIVAGFSDAHLALSKLPSFLAAIPDYIAADGIGVYDAGEVTMTGATPLREEFLDLVKFLDQTTGGRVFSVHRLSDLYPPAVEFPMRAAGLLCLPISCTPRRYMVFFRKGVLPLATWGEAIAPNAARKNLKAQDDMMLCNQSARWLRREMQAAEGLRLRLAEQLLKISEASQAEHNVSAQRQEIMIAELNHRVRNMLGLVRGLIKQSATKAERVDTLVNSLDARINALARAYDLLTARAWKPGSLHALLCAEFETYRAINGRLILAGPDVMIEPRAYTTTALVVHELMTNARKYGALCVPAGSITVQSLRDEAGNAKIYWRERGGPKVVPPIERGFGTTILEQAIPFEVQGTSRLSFLPSGCIFELMLPASVAVCVESTTQSLFSSGDDCSGTDERLVLLLRQILVVEDNLFIAIDAEDMLRQLGASRVDIVRSVPEAMEAMAQQAYSFALLDIDLGAETSLPIAAALRACNTPFAFGTGYGDALKLNGTLADVQIVSKPYHRAALISALMAVVETLDATDRPAPMER